LLHVVAIHLFEAGLVAHEVLLHGLARVFKDWVDWALSSAANPTPGLSPGSDFVFCARPAVARDAFSRRTTCLKFHGLVLA
jgi:hypothetical protein